MLRRSPIRQNLVNRAAGRMGPISRRPMSGDVSPLRSPPRGRSRVLPPHLMEKHNRVDFLRKFGLGRRRADRLVSRSYKFRETDEELRDMMRMPMGQPDCYARLRKLLQLLDPTIEIPLPLARAPPPPQPPSPPRDINWFDSPKPYSPRMNSNYGMSPLLNRRPDNRDRPSNHQTPYDDMQDTNYYDRSPLRCSSPYIDEPPYKINRHENHSNIDYREFGSREPDSSTPFRLNEEDPPFVFPERVSTQNNCRNIQPDAQLDDMFRQFYNKDSGTYNFSNSDLVNLISSNPNYYTRNDLTPSKANKEPVLSQHWNNMPFTSNRNSRYPRRLESSNLRSGPAKRKTPEDPSEKNPQLMPKRQRQRGFHIGGFRLPYTKSNLNVLPQPENKSHAARFFKKSPNYIIGSCSPESVINYDQGEMSDEDSVAGDVPLDEEGNPNMRRCLKQRMAETMCLEWAKIYRSKNYRNWHNWWKDFQWCEIGIEKQLERFNGYNVKYTFVPNDSFHQEQDEGSRIESITNRLLKAAHLALVKNRNGYLYNMRTIYQLMSESFLENLSMSSIEQLLDIIRSVPNHLWVYKMRSMIFMWSKYWELSPKATDINQPNSMATSKEWNNPVFHWLAKQAFAELKLVSRIEWSGHLEFFAV